MRRFLKDYVAPYWKQIAVLMVFVVLQVYLQLQVLSETHDILNGGVANQDMDFIRDAGIRMIAMTLMYGLSIVLVSYLSAYLSASVTCDVRRDLFRRIMTFSQKDFSRFGGSTLMTRLTADMLAVNNPSQLVILLPATLADGEYTLTVTTQYSGSGRLLKTPRSVSRTLFIGESAAQPGGGEGGEDSGQGSFG